MTDLLVFAVTPDQVVRKTVQVAVTEEGHHLQTFHTSVELLAALEKNTTPHLVLLEPEANSEELYNKLRQHVPELNLCFMVKLVEGIDVSVLILGESGTGKEIIAHLLHKHSPRAHEKFVNVNCAALPMDLLESELFGHVKGAFTGAISDKPGRFEQSSGGTILLDEIGEISASMQAKLLHVLQDGQFTRLGGRQPTKVDVHVLAATNISMERALANKTFREDLYYRLNTFTINVPPLRERTEEIPFLVSEMIWRTPPSMKPAGFERFSTALLNLLPLYDWPGNLRELRNFRTRTMIMQDESAAIRELEVKIEKRICVKN